MRYLVILERGPESYGMFSPDVPGCVAVGDTVEEVTQRYREALRFHLEGLQKDGDPVPLPTCEASYLDVDVPHAAPSTP